MYICIRMLSTVGTGVLICSIIVLYLYYWILKKEKEKKKETAETTEQNDAALFGDFV